MENTKSDIQMNGMDKIKALFDKMCESSGHNLNRYISGNSLTVSDDMPEKLLHSLKDFLEEVQETVKETGDIGALIKEIQNAAGSEKFVDWLEGYLYDSIRPYQDAVYIREANLEKFREITSYVFENMILTNNGNAQIDTEVAGKKEILSTKKILLTFVNRVICYNDGKTYIFENMERRFGLHSEKCEIWWNLVKENEDRLWKIMLMRRVNFIENKLNHLLDCIQD